MKAWSYILWSLVIVAVVAVGWYIYNDMTVSADVDNPPTTPTTPPDVPSVEDDTSSSDNPPAAPGTPAEVPSVEDETGDDTADDSASDDTSGATSTDTTDTTTSEGAKAATTGPVEVGVIIALALISFISFKKYSTAKKHRL